MEVAEAVAVVAAELFRPIAVMVVFAVADSQSLDCRHRHWDRMFGDSPVCVCG